MVLYEVRFDDGEHIMTTPLLNKAVKYWNENNRYNRSIHIYQITNHSGWNETRIV